MAQVTVEIFIRPEDLPRFLESHDDDLEVEVSFVQNGAFRLHVHLDPSEFEFKTTGDPAQISIRGWKRTAGQIEEFRRQAEEKFRKRKASGEDE